jgi:ABC-type sugar transport system permease subunit
MDERELDAILRGLAHERYAPTERLLTRTKAAIRGRRLLHVMMFLSLATQAVGVSVALSMLMSAEVGAVAKALTLGGLTAFFGAVAVSLVAARSHVVRFFKRVERLAS